VRQIDLGAQPGGLVRFKWDGIGNDGQVAPPGVYVVTANASVDGQMQALGTLVASRVESVSLNSNPPGATLNLRGGGSIGLDAVRELL
jgi:flagellar basal-body rod modification protein FlgD